MESLLYSHFDMRLVRNALLSRKEGGTRTYSFCKALLLDEVLRNRAGNT